MQWFTMAWWRWRLAQARGRNPLVRTSDRIEVAVIALAVAVSLFSLPVAGAIGTAVHDDRAHVYAEQRQDRHLATATATADSMATPRGPVAIHARWQFGDVENAGALTSDTPVKEGAPVDIWVDGNGRHVSAPAPSWQAGVDATAAAVAIWLSVCAAGALLVALVRRWLMHTRYAGWNRDIAMLVHDDGGRTNRRR
jgi:hypothetical protein